MKSDTKIEITLQALKELHTSLEASSDRVAQVWRELEKPTPDLDRARGMLQTVMACIEADLTHVMNKLYPATYAQVVHEQIETEKHGGAIVRLSAYVGNNEWASEIYVDTDLSSRDRAIRKMRKALHQAEIMYNPFELYHGAIRDRRQVQEMKVKRE